MITSAANITVKLLTNKLPDLKNPTFNRDPAFIGDPASIRTLASSLLHLVVTAVVPMFAVYVHFTLRVNAQCLY